MNEGIIILILSIVAMVLAGIICYQQFAFRKGIKAQLLQISQELAGAVDSDSEEKVMVFTDSRAVQELCAQINRLLDRHQITGEVKFHQRRRCPIFPTISRRLLRLFWAIWKLSA